MDAHKQYCWISISARGEECCKCETFKAVYGKEVDHLKNKSIYEKHIRKFLLARFQYSGPEADNIYAEIIF